MVSPSDTRLLAAFLVLAVALATPALAAISVPFSAGDPVTLECKNSSGVFGPAVTCSENNKPLSFVFGQDTFLYCGVVVTTQEFYTFVANVIEQKDAWQCRVPMSKDLQFFLPLTIPLWGIVEPSHVHINYHMNFAFHVDDGRIIGVTAYPVRDRFQYVKVGSTVNLHGPIKWFSKHSYKALSESDQHATAGASMTSIIGYCLFTGLVVAVLGVLAYQFILKPRLVKRFLKSD